MQNGIKRADGTSKLLRGADSIPTSWEGFRAALIAGEVPVDIIQNAEGWVRQPTPLNVYTLLKDETCLLMNETPDDMVPDDAFRILLGLASMQSGSSESGAWEDTSFECGTFTNAGAGWNSYRFRETFDAPPQVLLTAEDFEGTVLVKEVTAEGFLYCLKLPTKAEGLLLVSTAGTVTTKSVYVGQQSGAGGNNISQRVVTDVLFPSLTLADSEITTTAQSIKINYFAIEYGGER